MGTDNKKIRRAILRGELARTGSALKLDEAILLDAARGDEEIREIVKATAANARKLEARRVALEADGFDVEVHDGRELS